MFFDCAKRLIYGLTDILGLFGDLFPPCGLGDIKAVKVFVLYRFLYCDPLFVSGDFRLLKKLIAGTFEEEESEDIVFKIRAVDMPTK
jgi:hypothetical protein